MKKYISLLFCLFIGVIQAQTIKESITTEPNIVGWEVKTMLYDNNGSVYVLRIHPKYDIKFSIEKYNSETLALDFYKMYGQEDFKGKDIKKVPVGLFLLSGQPYLLLYQEAPAGCASRLFSIGANGELTYKTELINSGIEEDNTDLYGAYTFGESNEIRPTGLPDMPYVYLYGEKDDKNAKEKLIYLDKELNVVKTLSITIPTPYDGLRIFDFVSDKEENSYLLVHAYASYTTGDITNKYLLYKIDSKGVFTEIKTEPGGNKILSNAKLHVNRKGEPVIAGVYKDSKDPALFHGFFVTNIISTATSITPNTQYAFNDSFAAKAVKFKTVDDIVIKNIFENKDSSYTIFFKKTWLNLNIPGPPPDRYNVGNMRVIKYNYAPDQFIINRSVECGIAVINVDEKGIRWDKSITSSKEFGTNDNSLSGAYFTKSPKGYNLIFDGFEPIDARKKKSEPVYYFYSFAENGNYTRTIVPAKDDWVINLFRKCHYPCVDEKGNIFRPSHILLPSKIKIVKFQFD